MRWAALWLSLGFALKWTREAWAAARVKCKAVTEGWGEALFDLLLLVASFAVVWLTFSVLHATTGQAFMILLFWSFVLVVFKVK